MSMSFKTTEHIVPCQHIRQHDDQQSTTRPKLVVKQYSPVNALPSPGDVTIIAAHGNGFVKELYEPLWEDLSRFLAIKGRRIRSIWIADAANQGASGLLNQDTKYDDVSWFDHTRDLLHLVNHFRDEMIQPIVGIGHSMGANQLAMLSIGHPRLFSTLVLIEPIIADAAIEGWGPVMAKMTLRRRTDWPSRQAAEAASAKAFKFWDPRVLDMFYKFALYPSPGLSSQVKETPTRLLTDRYQELGGILRPTYIYDGHLNPDQTPWVEEALVINDLIPFIPCSTKFICGEMSMSAGPEARKDWIARTGAGKHMGMPRRKSRVEETVLPKASHFVTMERPTACAEAAANWLDEEISAWEQKNRGLVGWRKLPTEEKKTLADTWIANSKAKI